MRSQTIFIAFTFILLAGCKSQQSSTKDNSDALTLSITKKLGGMAERQNNFNKTHVLAWSKVDRSAQPMLRYGVWEISSAELILAGSAVDGKVVWLDNTTLLVDDYKGLEGTDSPANRYKIDINTQVRVPIMSSSYDD